MAQLVAEWCAESKVFGGRGGGGDTAQHTCCLVWWVLRSFASSKCGFVAVVASGLVFLGVS